MINDKTQTSGDGCFNIQAQGSVNFGLSYTEAKDLVMDLFEQNFYKLSEKALNLAKERVDELVSEYFTSVSQDSSIDTNIFSDPSFQHTFFEAQKEYAKIGDPDLKIKLINTLIERTKETNRNTKQIILDEVIKTLPKLTNEHIDYLSLRFSLIDIMHTRATNLENLKDVFNKEIMIFFNPEILKKHFTLHLEYCNCLTLLSEGSTYKPLGELYRERYAGLFSKGFIEEDFRGEIRENISEFDFLIIPCFHSPEKSQFNCMNKYRIAEKLKANNKEDKKTQDFFRLLDNTTMNISDVEIFLSKINPDLKVLIDSWKKGHNDFNAMRLTPVGRYIAILNYNQKTKSNLKIEDFMQ